MLLQYPLIAVSPAYGATVANRDRWLRRGRAFIGDAAGPARAPCNNDRTCPRAQARGRGPAFAALRATRFAANGPAGGGDRQGRTDRRLARLDPSRPSAGATGLPQSGSRDARLW